MKADVRWISLIFVLTILLLVTPMKNWNISALQVYPKDSKIQGSTFGQWTAKWWNWIMSIPHDTNPIVDKSGVHCALGQSGDVWFLAGTNGGGAERTCSIPAGKAILFPVLNTECSFAETPGYKSEADLRKCAAAEGDIMNNVHATVDGIALNDSQIPRIQSPLFNFVLPPNSIFGAPQGPSQAVSDGRWVFLHPLEPGNHKITFGGTEGSVISPTNSAQDMIYRLTVR